MKNKNDKPEWDVNFEFVRAIHNENIKNLEVDLKGTLPPFEREAYEHLMKYLQQIKTCIDGYEEYLKTK